MIFISFTDEENLVVPVQVGSWIRTLGDAGTVPTHQAGDYILVLAVRGDTSAQPTLPAGYTNLDLSVLGSSGPGVRAAYKVAASAGETVSGFTGAQSIIIGVFRNITSLEITGYKTTSSAMTTTIWRGFPSLVPPALVVGLAVTNSTDKLPLRGDLTLQGTWQLNNAGGEVNVGSTGSLITAWPETTSTKVGTVTRAVSVEIALH